MVRRYAIDDSGVIEAKRGQAELEGVLLTFYLIVSAGAEEPLANKVSSWKLNHLLIFIHRRSLFESKIAEL